MRGCCARYRAFSGSHPKAGSLHIAWNCRWGHLHVLGQILEKEIFSIYLEIPTLTTSSSSPTTVRKTSTAVAAGGMISARYLDWVVSQVKTNWTVQKKRLTWGELQRCQPEPPSPLSSPPAHLNSTEISKSAAHHNLNTGCAFAWISRNTPDCWSHCVHEPLQNDDLNMTIDNASIK